MFFVDELYVFSLKKIGSAQLHRICFWMVLCLFGSIIIFFLLFWFRAATVRVQAFQLQPVRTFFFVSFVRTCNYELSLQFGYYILGLGESDSYEFVWLESFVPFSTVVLVILQCLDHTAYLYLDEGFSAFLPHSPRDNLV